MRTLPAAASALAFALVTASAAPAQQAGERDLAEAVRSAAGTAVHFSFTARPGVCGDGHRTRVRRSERDDRPWWCEPGPVRVEARTEADGRVRALDVRIGGPMPEGGVDLGRVRAPSAARWLLDLARRAGEEVAEDAIGAAVVADSFTAWPRLIEIARDDSRPGEVKEAAVFWVGQAAADSVEGRSPTGELASLSRDERQALEVRKHAVFALSQRPDDEAVPALVRLAREGHGPELTRSVLFWLGESDDSRALALFEEILLGKSGG